MTICSTTLRRPSWNQRKLLSHTGTSCPPNSWYKWKCYSWRKTVKVVTGNGHHKDKRQAMQIRKQKIHAWLCAVFGSYEPYRPLTPSQWTIQALHPLPVNHHVKTKHVFPNGSGQPHPNPTRFGRLPQCQSQCWRSLKIPVLVFSAKGQSPEVIFRPLLSKLPSKKLWKIALCIDDWSLPHSWFLHTHSRTLGMIGWTLLIKTVSDPQKQPNKVLLPNKTHFSDKRSCRQGQLTVSAPNVICNVNSNPT